MRLSIKIATVFGIPVRLHASMLLVPILFGGFFDGYGSVGPLTGLVSLVLLFASVLAHELGHALTARRFGIRSKEILLTPIGGIAYLTSQPKRPGHEIAIAAAGPLVSLAIAAIAYGVLVPLISAAGAAADLQLLAVSLFYANLMLGLFNLIPALPMDGGRVLRGLLATRGDHLAATRSAVTISRAIAVIGGLVGFFMLGSFNLALIAVFIFMSAGAELRAASYSRPFRPAVGRTSPSADGSGARSAYPSSSSAQAHSEPGPYWRGRPVRKTDWTKPEAPNPEVVVIRGGNAQVVGRKNP